MRRPRTLKWASKNFERIRRSSKFEIEERSAIGFWEESGSSLVSE